MLKKLGFPIFHRYRSSSSSSNSSLENYNAYGNKNMKKQQKMAEKMIKCEHGYGVLQDTQSYSFDPMSQPCTMLEDHDVIDSQVNHHEKLNGFQKHVPDDKNDMKHHNFGHHKLFLDDYEKANHQNEVNSGEMANSYHNGEVSEVPNECEGQNGHDEHSKHHKKHHYFGRKFSDHNDKLARNHQIGISEMTKNQWQSSGNIESDEFHGQGQNRKHSIHDIFGSLAWYGKHHHFGHHKIPDEENEINDHNHKMGISEIIKSRWRSNGNNVSGENIRRKSNGERLHEIFGALGRHGKHQRIGHHKKDDHDNEMNPWGTGTANGTDNEKDITNKTDKHSKTRRHTFHFGQHGKNSEKHHNFGHHKMNGEKDEHHGHSHKAGKFGKSHKSAYNDIQAGVCYN